MTVTNKGLLIILVDITQGQSPAGLQSMIPLMIAAVSQLSLMGDNRVMNSDIKR